MNRERTTTSTTGRLRRVALALLMAASPLAAFPAAAAPLTAAQNDARAHFKKGEADYAAGQYVDALAAYQAGYDAEPLPGFLVNIAQCQRRMGDLERARATYQKFIMVAPDSPLVPEVRKLVEDLDRLLAEAAAAERPAPAPEPAAGAGSNETMELGTASDPAAAPIALGATAPAEAAPNHVGGTTPAEAQPASGRRWWLWGGAAAVVVVGVATTAVLLSRDGGTTTIHDGSLGTVRR